MKKENTKDHISKRRTFAIVSHPDAGKTTITEKLLLWGNVIQTAGAVKGKANQTQTKSDWMALEKERGISVSTSVMQFYYQDHIFNLLDTPGHSDFSEDTYRTLTAVDSSLILIDAAKGVEERTLKLVDICRMRSTPMITFINKFDRYALSPIELLQNIEDKLEIDCTPFNWPLGSGQLFKGVYHFQEDRIYQYKTGYSSIKYEPTYIQGFDSDEAKTFLGNDYNTFYEEIELIKESYPAFDQECFDLGLLTPVFFGTALGNFGIDLLLNHLAFIAPSPLPKKTQSEPVDPYSPFFSGFVFKIQANMDSSHRDRMTFIRICSGKYEAGMHLTSVRLNQTFKNTQAMTFMSGNRDMIEEAYAGDIIGFLSHGKIRIGDTLIGSLKEDNTADKVQFIGIPYFAPELFKKVIAKDPLKDKQLTKGLKQLSEEGAVQVFRTLNGRNSILGAIGSLQFEVVSYRLKVEYKADCLYELFPITTVRWLVFHNEKIGKIFKEKFYADLAEDEQGNLVYMARNWAKLTFIEEKYGNEITFLKFKEIS